MKHLFLTVVIVVLLIGVGFFVALSADNEQQIPVRIAYTKTVLYNDFFVAEEKGYFREEGLSPEFILVSNVQYGFDAVVAGRTDVVIGSLLTALSLEYSMPGKFEAIALQYTDSYETEVNRIIVKQDSDIVNLADLKGKKLAVSGSRVMTVVTRFVLKNFLDPNDVTIINIPYEEHITALQSGGVDAALTQEPISTYALQTGNFREVGKGEYSRAKYCVNPYYTSVFAVSPSFITKYPEGCKKLQRALAKALKFRKENEYEAREIVGKYTGYPSEAVQKMHMFFTHMSWELDKVALQKAADIFSENDLLKGKVDTTKILFE